MLLVNGDNDRTAWMFPERRGRIVGHAVVPCSLARDVSTPGLYHLCIYDSYHPGQYRVVDIDSSDGTWQYAPWGWGGSKGLFLMDDVGAYLGFPTIPGMGSSGGSTPGSHGEETGSISVFSSTTADIVISNMEGDSVGYIGGPIDGAAFVEMENASPVVAPTADAEHGRAPVGYLVPTGTYETRISNSQHTHLSYSVFGDSGVFVYTRTDCQHDQIDRLSYSQDGRRFEARNLDQAARSISLKVVSALEDREMTGGFDELGLAPGDGLILEIVDQTCFRISNEGPEKTYHHLTLELGTREFNPLFVHYDVPLGEGCAHLICPDWELLDGQPVAVLIDCDSNGEYEETLYVENQWGGRGEINGDGSVDLGDAVFLTNYLFKEGSAPDRLEVADVNGDHAVNIGDVVYLISYLYKNGPPPVSK